MKLITPARVFRRYLLPDFSAGEIYKFVRAMKITVILLIAGCLHLSATGLSQQITASFKQTPLEQVVHEIGRQTRYNFIYDAGYMINAVPVTANLIQVSLEPALKQVFAGQPLIYEVDGNAIYIRPAKMESRAPNDVQAGLQPRIYTGMVADETGKGIPGATIQIKSKSGRTVADKDGQFRISAEPGDVLLISTIGYTGKEEVLDGRMNRGTISLRQSSTDLDEGFVIGYGTVTREDMTGSIGEVKITEMTKAPVTSFDQALAGRVAGVQVSSSDGQPGSGMNIVIRGANSLTQDNSPLYVIDGFPVEDMDNASINPEEIASINILKDASATAIYGSRGANGVIIIETKKGREGKAIVTLNTSLGYQQVQKKMDMMNPYEFVTHQLEVLPVTGKRLYTPADLLPNEVGYDADGLTLEDYRTIGGTNWQDLIFRNSPMEIHNLAIRGGNADTRYALSGSIADQEGIVLNTGSKRYQGRVTLDHSLNSRLKVGMTANYSKNSFYGQQVKDGGGANFTSFLLYRAWAYRPVSGKAGLDLEELDIDPDNTNASDIRINPVVSSNNEYNRSATTNFMANGYAQLDILRDLQWKTTASVRGSETRRDQFYNSKTPQGSPRNASNSRGVQGSIRNSGTNSWSAENTLTYTGKFQKSHRLTAMGGFSVQSSTSENFGFWSQTVPNELLGIYGLDEGIPYQSEALGGEFGLVSYFTRVNYNYKSKYLLTATMRADGSSKFSPGNRWGYFPSAAVAWNMKRENFLRNMSAISISKLRASYGETGNNRIGNYEYFTMMGLPLSSSYSFNDSPMQGTIISRLGNDKLRWETTSQFDVGYDLGLFGGRIEFVADYYRKVTRDLLLSADMPATTGYLRSFKNIGSILNHGFEFTLNTVNLKSADFSWSSSFNISLNKNRVLELTDNQETMFSNMTVGQDTGPLYITRVGYPAGMFYGYIFDGIYQVEDFDSPAEGVYTLKAGLPDNGTGRSTIQPGHVKYRDMNNDGIVNADDRSMIGRGLPVHTGGFNNNFTYKGLSLNVFFQWSYGNQVYNANRLIFEGSYINMFNVNQYASYNDRWTPENRSNTLYKVGGQGAAGYQSTRLLEDASYLRLKTVSLSYTVPNRVFGGSWVRNLAVHASAQNLLTFSDYSGMDPEVSVRHSVLTPGFDYSAYPQARTITFGINAEF